MEEKMLPVPNEGHRRRQKQRRRRFPWGSIATVILVVAVCVYAFTLFGDKESPENSQVNDTTTQGPDDVQVGLLDESFAQDTENERLLVFVHDRSNQPDSKRRHYCPNPHDRRCDSLTPTP